MSSPTVSNDKKPDQAKGYIAYHGSLTRGITSFNPGSHFGTFEQALVCIGAHAFIDDEQPILPTLYKCRLKLKESDICRITDWGSPRYQAALMAYMNHMAKSDLKKKTGYAKMFQGRVDSSDALALKILNKEVLRRGHELIPCGNKLNVVEYESNLENANTILTANWDNSSHLSALTAYLNEVEKIDRKRKSAYLSALQSPGKETESLALKFLYAETAQRGHRAFKYYNKVESTDRSMMTLYEEDVEILESWEPCRNEVFKAFSANIHRLRPPNFESAMRKAEQFKNGII